MATLLLAILLVIVVCLETFCNTALITGGNARYVFNIDRITVTWIYFSCGLLLSLLPLIRIRKTPRTHRLHRGWFAAGLLILSSWFVASAYPLFALHPLDHLYADMLPILKIMAERFVRGEYPYAVIPEIFGGMKPIYLPAMWLPFVPAVLIGTDVRWMLLTATLVSFTMILLMSGKRARSVASLCLFLPLALWGWSTLEFDPEVLLYSEELIVVTWYVALVIALRSENPVWIGVTLVLCVLSRYSHAFWALAYFIHLYFYYNRRRFFTTILVSATAAILLMFATGAYRELFVFSSLQSRYLDAVINERWKYAPVINENLGFAKLFRYESLPSLHTIFFACAIAIPAIAFLLFRFVRNSINHTLFLICSLKLSLVFFYNLLIIPYSYLFYTSTVLSIALLSVWFSLVYDRSETTIEVANG